MAKKTQVAARERRKAEKKFPFKWIGLAVAVILIAAIAIGLIQRSGCNANPRTELEMLQTLACEAIQPENLVASGGGSQSGTVTGLVYRYGDIPDGAVHDLVNLIGFTAELLRTRPVLNSEAFTLNFSTPQKPQVFILLNVPREILPPVLQNRGEATMLGYSSLDNPEAAEATISFINISDYRGELTQPEVYGSVIQAVCLGYTQDDLDHDAKCNVFSQNAAMGWSGVEQQQARESIEGLGWTNVGHLNDTPDQQYVWWEMVYTAFKR